MKHASTSYPQAGLEITSGGVARHRQQMSGWVRRADMALRIVAAVPLGYAVASAWAMALARFLPGDPAQATIAATLVAFALCAFAAMWAFAASSGWRAMWTLSLLGCLAGGVTWLSIAATGRL